MKRTIFWGIFFLLTNHVSAQFNTHVLVGANITEFEHVETDPGVGLTLGLIHDTRIVGPINITVGFVHSRKTGILRDVILGGYYAGRKVQLRDIEFSTRIFEYQMLLKYKNLINRGKIRLAPFIGYALYLKLGEITEYSNKRFIKELGNVDEWENEYYDFESLYEGMPIGGGYALHTGFDLCYSNLIFELIYQYDYSDQESVGYTEIKDNFHTLVLALGISF